MSAARLLALVFKQQLFSFFGSLVEGRGLVRSKDLRTMGTAHPLAHSSPPYREKGLGVDRTESGQGRNDIALPANPKL